MIERLTQEVIILLDQHPQQVYNAIPGGFAFDVADGRVLEKFIATAGHAAKRRKGQNKESSCRGAIKIRFNSTVKTKFCIL